MTSIILGATILSKAVAPIVAVLLYVAALASATVILRKGDK